MPYPLPTMLLQFDHQTDLFYDEPIGESVMELRVCPTQGVRQRRLAFDLDVAPPTTSTSYHDWLGNTVHALTLNLPHRRVRVRGRSVIETFFARNPVSPLTWPLDKETIPFTLHDFLQFGGPIVAGPALDHHVDALGAKAGEPVSDIAYRLIDHIHSTFTYESGVTTSASTIADLLEGGRGVCQDFTHLGVAMARRLGIPARYVSGLIHPLDEKTRGFTQTHAWCELLAGDPGGEDAWLAVDPTNNNIVSENYARVAIGRDYRDVPPNKGVWRGSGHERIEVRVDSRELDALPNDVAARPDAQLPGDVVDYAPPPGWTGREHIDPYAQSQQQQQQ